MIETYHVKRYLFLIVFLLPFDSYVARHQEGEDNDRQFVHGEAESGKGRQGQE